MSNKSLLDKAIKIQGKDYVLVSDRVIFFNENYPSGMIETRLISEPDAELVVIKAKVTPNTENPNRYFTGYSQAKWGEGYINKTSALENCETSAVGRALAMMGIGVIDSIASVDEINKATNQDSFDVADTAVCPIHKVKMFEKVKDDGTSFFWHKLPSGEFCNGRNTKYNKAKN